MPRLRQKVMKSIYRSKQNSLKTTPFRAEHPRYCHVREYPSLPPTPTGREPWCFIGGRGGGTSIQ